MKRVSFIIASIAMCACCAMAVNVEVMPRWIPGTVMGRPVNVRYVIPLHFLLDPARANKKRLLIMPRAKHLGQR